MRFLLSVFVLSTFISQASASGKDTFDNWDGSRKWMKGEYVVVDLETTGSSYEDEIIQITMRKLNDGKQIDIYNSYVKPSSQATLSHYAVKAHGLTIAFLIDKPKFQDIISDIIAFIDGNLLVGHNVRSFDSRFLQREIERCQGLGQVILYYKDTLSMARRDHARSKYIEKESPAPKKVVSLFNRSKASIKLEDDTKRLKVKDSRIKTLDRKNKKLAAEKEDEKNLKLLENHPFKKTLYFNNGAPSVSLKELRDRVNKSKRERDEEKENKANKKQKTVGKSFALGEMHKALSPKYINTLDVRSGINITNEFIELNIPASRQIPHDAVIDTKMNVDIANSLVVNQ